MASFCPKSNGQLIFHRFNALTSRLSKSKTRFSLVFQVEGAVAAFTAIRQYLEGFKVGPLIGMSPEIAHALLIELVKRFGAENVVLDVPEPNRPAKAQAEGFGLLLVFETARMFKGGRPDYWLDGLFGVTSFESG
ncbi:hypothetical protein IMCC3135_17945 [Granulosicoccus antarcticus IMCC3135]|uniref:YitH/HolE acetyltransferase (GNAT) domain-containing protein n=2 Tax=Granulosicoccus TaxID=437504 RepID=A0A2Z2NVB9_9GAMM|nr:hypothetical protein [Granulosicoccus antarcticus]ASJ73668.1 hypothetical protein IMCC3135_17945 [Granulosicoccus antarcticus IMCC3135]